MTNSPVDPVIIEPFMVDFGNHGNDDTGGDMI
jgi:hypothetical protein